MSAKRILFILLLTLVVKAGVLAQPQYDIVEYDEEDGLPSDHITQMLQDEQGFIWFSTWNGLCRFDGYEFRTFKSVPGDSCHITSDRLRNIWLSDEGDIYCRVEADTFLFDTGSYRFLDITTPDGKAKARAAERHVARRGRYNGQFFEFTDRQGLWWQLRDGGVRCLRPIRRPEQPVAQQLPAQTRCMARDGEGRIWMTTREDATVRLFDASLLPLGYLRPDGALQPGYVSFGHPVYCITQTRDGIVWLGSKPGGLFRYDSRSGELRHIEHLPHQAVYDIKEDRRGRLWIATLGGGLLCKDGDSISQFLAPLRVRYIHLTKDDILLATTTEGLVAGRLEANVGSITFRLHQREPERKSSLNCNATMDIWQDGDGRLFVSTESGGVSEVVSEDLLADTLSFRPLPMRGGWPTEVALSMAGPSTGGDMLITSSNQLIAYDTRQGTGTSFDSWFFHHRYRFSEVRPLLLDDGRWLIGSMEGAFTLAPQDMRRQPFVPNLALTAVAIQQGATRYAVNHLDTLCLSPTERSLTIQFAALDFSNARRIRYEYRFGGDDAPWSPIGHDHSVTLLDLQPGTYELWLHSTNADGTSVDNYRRLVIVAEPAFWESVWGRLLLAGIVVLLLLAIAATILYIRRIKRKQHETLQAYLALVKVQEAPLAGTPQQPESPRSAPAPEQLDPVIQRVMLFIEQNIGNSDASVGAMAEAAATSRSGLQRKLKQAMGITPQDLLREARLKHACRLLEQTGKSVSEIAYDCGFTDPKYFSRCFKQSTGRSPSEYKNSVNQV